MVVPAKLHVIRVLLCEICQVTIPKIVCIGVLHRSQLYLGHVGMHMGEVSF